MLASGWPALVASNAVVGIRAGIATADGDDFAIWLERERGDTVLAAADGRNDLPIAAKTLVQSAVLVYPCEAEVTQRRIGRDGTGATENNLPIRLQRHAIHFRFNICVDRNEQSCRAITVVDRTVDVQTQQTEA